MSDTESVETLSGSCLCGGVGVTARVRRRAVSACHCAMCRNWTGGPWMVIDSGKDVEFTGDEHIARYQSSDWATRGFCRRCGSHLFYLFMPVGHYSISAGLIDNVQDFTFSEQIFVDEKPDFYAFANDTHELTGAEVIAKFTGGG